MSAVVLNPTETFDTLSSAFLEAARKATDALAPENWPQTLTQEQKHKLCFAHIGMADAVDKVRRTLGKP